MGQRKLFSKREAPFFAAVLVLLAAALLLASRAPRGTWAVLEVEGQVVERRDLDRLEGPETVELQGAEGIQLTVEFSPEGARVLSANCPDQTCQRTGRLTRAGESAVCLPGRVVLRLEGPEEAADAVTY